jgi:hypothetical protein
MQYENYIHTDFAEYSIESIINMIDAMNFRHIPINILLMCYYLYRITMLM